MRPRLGVVVPNYDGAAVLPRCLAALAEQDEPPDEVLVVDNGSRDGSADGLEQRWPGVRTLRLPANLGFGAAANAGAAVLGTDLVCVLNSDARPTSAWARTVRDGAALGGWSWGVPLVDPLGRVESAGDCFSLHGYSYKQAQGRRLAELPGEPWEVFAPPGAAPVFRRDALLALGGYDERYFLYLEDLDLAFRARSRGARSYVLPGAAVEHDGGASGTRVTAVRHIARNSVWCLVLHAPRVHARLLWRTTRREWQEARRRGEGAAYARGRVSSAAALPRLVRERRTERQQRTVTGEALARACDLGPTLLP